MNKPPAKTGGFFVVRFIFDLLRRCYNIFMNQKTKLVDYVSIINWVMVMRLVVFGFFTIALVLLWQMKLLEFNPAPVFVILFSFILLELLILYFSKNKEFLRLFVFYGLLLLDIIIVTAIVHFSGGKDSPFVFLYLVPIVAASLFSLRLVAVFIPLSLVFYGGILLLEHFNIIEPVVLSVFEPAYYEIMRRVARFVILSVMVVFQSYYFFSCIRKKDEEILKTRNEFLFKTIHELRSPSVGIKWAIEKFSQKEFLDRNPDANEFLSDLNKMNEREIKLLKDLTMAAKGQETRVVFQKTSVDLQAIIRGILNEVEPSAAKKKVAIDYPTAESAVLILADQNRVYEVFFNLVDNAIKYNKTGGMITILHKKEGDSVVTLIEDTGLGIAKENLKKIFMPYFRAIPEEKIPGTGLGLYIVKNLVEKMGGKIEISSDFGIGTKISVFLPRA